MSRAGQARDLLCELIRYPSLSGQEQEIIAFLAQRLRADLEGEVLLVPIPESIKADPDYTSADQELSYEGRANLVLRRPGGGDGRSLILQAHTDVVPADPGWEQAFAPLVEGERVQGRGAADCKGSLVAIWVALAALDALGVRLRGDLEAQFVIEEEFGGNGALALILGGHRADGALIMEGTRLQVHPANRGAIWFRAEITGKSVHMGRKHEGVSAIEQAVEFIGICDRYEERLVAESQGQPLFSRYQHPVQVNVGMIRGGDWPSTVPARAVVEGGIGFLPNKRMGQIQQELQRAVAGEGSEWLRSHISLGWPKLHNDAYQTDPGHPFVRAVAGACAEAGLASEVYGWNVSCDARLYHHRGGMPTVVFGPGDIAQAHASGEWINMTEVCEAARALVHLALGWCGTA